MIEKKFSAVSIDDKKKNEMAKPHNEKIDLVTDKGPKFGCRHVQVLLLASGLMCGFATKMNLSIAIVAMTDNTTSPNPNVPTYHWNNTGVILSSFFWSQMTVPIIAAYLGKTYGPKYFLLVAFFVNCCACALIPPAAAKFGSTGVILCRIFQGFGQGFLLPSLNVVLGVWAPEQEVTTLSTIVIAGLTLSSMFSAVLTGYISASWWGWPASFYALASAGFVWCFLWLCFGQNSPASHPRITDQERNYIQSSLNQHDHNDLPIPWKKILTSVPFYALLVTYMCNEWGWSIMMTEMPTYLSKAMKFDVKSNSLISAMPDTISFFVVLILGPLSDWIISKKILSRRNVRRISNGIGVYSQGAALILLSFLKPSQASWSPVILGVGGALSTFMAIGMSVNHLDLSPRFGGVIFGIINTCGQVWYLLAPLSVTWMVTDSTSVSQWQIVFLIAAGLFILGGTVFFFFMSDTRQAWDGSEETKQEEKQKKLSVVQYI